ncbi:hypothetical protein [Singulisphaera sp. PoT]|uniref:hypothetical protein n=1 Tax=Singulisphaera sp. PoT TaxID=3411797 RepID=UPI003BF56222
MRTRLKTAAGLALLLLLAARPGHAQYGFFGGGYGASTVQGDILRGEGAFLNGAGNFLYKEAVANSINVDTSIRLNEYIWNVVKFENRENAKHRAAMIAKHNENYDMILKRIRENPDNRDLETGDALNDVMTQLLDPGISPSSFRGSPVNLPGETIRGIPFFYAAEDATFSMRRLAAKNHWPVGLRGERFARYRRDYERAFDDALDQQHDGKLSREAILRVEKSLADLNTELPRVITPSKDKVYIEARDFLSRLDKSKELLKRQKVEEMLGEIDRYSGTSVHDLVTFMQKYSLRFGVPDLGVEREQYPKLYEAMKLQLDMVRVQEPGGGGLK